MRDNRTYEEDMVELEAFRKKMSGIVDFSVVAVQSPSRKRELVWTRSLIAWYLYNVGRMTYARVGAVLGDRDHATVIHLCRVFDDISGRDDDPHGVLFRVVRRMADNPFGGARFHEDMVEYHAKSLEHHTKELSKLSKHNPV